MMNSYELRKQKVNRIHSLAQKAFAKHAIETCHSDGVFRHFHCSNNGSSIYSFSVTTVPGRLIVAGDIGPMMWERCDDMLQWAPSAIGSIDYFEEKVPQGFFTKEYDPDVARAVLLELFDDEDLHGDKGLELVEKVRECLRYVDDGEQFLIEECYQKGLFDGADWPDFANWSSSFLWCREALLWFFQQRYLQ